MQLLSAAWRSVVPLRCRNLTCFGSSVNVKWPGSPAVLMRYFVRTVRVVLVLGILFLHSGVNIEAFLRLSFDFGMRRTWPQAGTENYSL